jgi:hypothetical protein
MKLNPDGTLLFQPSTNGIDVFDGHVGTLRTRLALPFSFGATYDNLVADGDDNVLIGIVGPFANQIAVIDLSSLPEPSPLPFATAPIGAPSRFAFRNAGAPMSHAAASLPTPASSRFIDLPRAPALGKSVPHVARPPAFWTPTRSKDH